MLLPDYNEPWQYLFGLGPSAYRRRLGPVTMTCIEKPISFEALDEVGVHVELHSDTGLQYRLTVLLVTAIFSVIVWCFLIVRKEQTPYTMMVEPATETLETGITASKDLSVVSKELAFKVDALDLKRWGGDLTAIGRSEFGGQHAAVMQYQYGDSIILVYTFPHVTSLFGDMKRVDSTGQPFYVTSGGAVSIAAWKDKECGYRALAAKATEKDILALAENVADRS